MPRTPTFTRVNREQDFATLARLNRKYTTDPDLPQELREFVGTRLRECMSALLKHTDSYKSKSSRDPEGNTG